MKTLSILLRGLLMLGLILVEAGCNDCNDDNDKPDSDLWIVHDGELTSGYDMGVNTSGDRVDWLSKENGYFRMAYPSGQTWGAVFITVGEPTDFPRASQDLSRYSRLSIELRGETGNESVLIGLKDNTDPDNGSETKFRVSDLTTDWQTFEFSLSDFETADLEKLYVVTEFVFEEIPQTVYFRSVKYLL